MTPFQQLYLGLGAKKKTYMDDVFSTYLYKGDASTRSINNGLDLSGEGGMTWIKARSNSTYLHHLYDTVRGVGRAIYSSQNYAQSSVVSNKLTAFNSNGFSLGADSDVNDSGHTYSSFSFRKAKGFFDVVTYTGNGTAGRTVSHSLGCVPGAIFIKRTDGTDDWHCYHRGVDSSAPEDYYLALNANYAKSDNAAFLNDTKPSSTVFTLGTTSAVNGNGNTYVAYLFAGGESTAATARSVDFDGSGDYLNTTDSSSDFNMGQGDFTVECWVKPDNYNDGICQISPSSGGLTTSDYTETLCMFLNGDGKLGIFANGTTAFGSTILAKGTWNHVAFTRSSGTAYAFVNGVLEIKTACSNSSSNFTGTYIAIGAYFNTSYVLDGKISNFRVLKGTALYTSSFRPPTEPLTNITNTKLLCCNNSSVTGSTVSPVTLYGPGDPTALTDSPFDDPAGFKFGDSKEGIIKCGSFSGNANADGPEINLGWEPQYILLKDTSSTNAWRLWDSMRGIVTGGDEARLLPDTDSAEAGADEIELTPTGFKAVTTEAGVNGNGSTIVYMAIRRPDGYVGKPIETGTDVFAMDTGAGSSNIPNFDSGFPVDFAFFRKPADTSGWLASSRLTAKRELYLNTNAAEGGYNDLVFDSNVGWESESAHGSDRQSWMWKRHAGFDVVTYKGNGTAGHAIPHSLSKTPEMIWIKDRESQENWFVYHKGANGGSSPEDYALILNSSNAEWNFAGAWNDTAPTSSHFTLGADSGVNGNNNDFIAMLFASVDGISKCGFYDGSSSSQTITTGFQPRFLMIKGTTVASDWFILDTTRGWSSGNDTYIMLNANSDQASDTDFGAPTSTGFTLTSGTTWNSSGNKFIYYAHA